MNKIQGLTMAALATLLGAAPSTQPAAPAAPNVSPQLTAACANLDAGAPISVNITNEGAVVLSCQGGTFIPLKWLRIR